MGFLREYIVRGEKRGGGEFLDILLALFEEDVWKERLEYFKDS